MLTFLIQVKVFSWPLKLWIDHNPVSAAEINWNRIHVCLSLSLPARGLPLESAAFGSLSELKYSDLQIGGKQIQKNPQEIKC